MKIERLVVGPIETNCYLLINNDKCVIIDPGAEANMIIGHIFDNNLTPVGYLITHTHYDHIEGLDEIVEEFNIDLMEPNSEFNYEVIATPGHKEDCLSFYFKEENVLFSGDTLFKDTIGRVDLPGGCEETMMKTIELLKQLPDETVVYPGHGPSTTIEYEKENNPWF